MISVARIVVRRSVFNKTRKWQNCDPARAAASTGWKSRKDFKMLGPTWNSPSKLAHAYVIVARFVWRRTKGQRGYGQRGLLVTLAHNKFLQNSVVVTA